MKILELCLSPDLGGLELYMYRCCDALVQAGDEVVAVTSPEGRLNEYLERAPAVRRVPLATRRGALPLLTARRLARLIDAEGIDLIHMHWGKDLPLAAFAKALSRRKPALVYTRQMQLTRPKRDFYHRFLYAQMDRMLTITELLARMARERLPVPERVRALYYGVKAPEQPLAEADREALRGSWGVVPGAMLVGLFGRIEPFKGQHLMVAAVSRLLAEGANINLLLVGHAMDEGYLAGLKRQVEQAGIAGRIRFEGFTDQAQRWMQACDVIALTTREETFGLVLAEAMRAGTAVLGSAAGGVPEIIEHGQSGLLFTPDDADSLYSQLRRYLDDPTERAAIAAAGRARADRLFDEHEHYARLREHFAELVPS